MTSLPRRLERGKFDEIMISELTDTGNSTIPSQVEMNCVLIFEQILTPGTITPVRFDGFVFVGAPVLCHAS